jgi:predicted phage baseplate assembly protein
MSLPVPNLDDRRFQDLVDDAKRLVQQHTRRWTDHNVSDPGVTLIEAYAWLTDQLLYRLNRVPELNYLKFLELIGVKLFPPTAAHTEITFWLSAPQAETVTIPTGTEVGTIRTGTSSPTVFSTTEDRPIVACSLQNVASMIGPKEVRDHGDALALKTGFLCFDNPPKPGDVLLLGLSDAVPACVVNLSFVCHIEGVGVDPDNPPLIWEAWTGEKWEACELEHDTTGGLNRDGEIQVHVPREHTPFVIDRIRAGWLRARVTDPEEGQPVYSASPEIRELSAFTIGGTAQAMNAGLIRNEVLGMAEGVPSGRFPLRHRPVVAAEKPLVVESREEGGEWMEWLERPNFAVSGPQDKHFVLDAVTGEVQFGPAVRLVDGTMRNYGAVPPKGATLRIPLYRSGGGSGGNLAARALTVLKASIPFVVRVENRRAAQGGVDGEDLESAKVRGPILLRTRDRAVTAEDFEHICREVAPEIARVRAMTGSEKEPGVVRVLVVPAVASTDGRIAFDQLVPSEETLERVTQRLDETRLLGTRVMVEPPVYRGLTIVARLRARPRTDPTRLQQEALKALFGYFHPITGGPDGTGWPFGRPIMAGDVYSCLQGLRGTEIVDDVRIFGADPVTGERGKATDRLEVEPNALVFSYDHQVVVEGAK